MKKTQSFKIRDKETVLITGASSGIGLHLAKECARHGHPLVLVAPVESELQQVAFVLTSAHPVKVRTIAKDLCQPDAAKEILEQLAGAPVDILINNAGHGKKGKFWEIPLEDDLSMLHLNIEAVVRLTELQGTHVTVTALCPGPTDTDFYRKADMMETRAFQQANLMAPQEVAKAAYEGLMAGNRLVVPGFGNKALVFLRRLIPESMAAKLNEIMITDVLPDQQKRRRGDKELSYKE